MRRKVSLRIRYRKPSDLIARLLLPVLIIVVVGQWVSAGQGAAADVRDVSSAVLYVRDYYLTAATYNGANATEACANGYHMASMWEILDPSSLKYNTSLGYTTDDSGTGPPVARGWVRTGYVSDNGETIGAANCEAWTTLVGYGTVATLPNSWEADWEDLLAWNVYKWRCNSTNARVWCVADRSGSWIFLPFVLRGFT